ncbi:MAG: hypothetical protein Q9208_003717 [Pyrenodesmia sp. 3 TL-2023]
MADEHLSGTSDVPDKEQTTAINEPGDDVNYLSGSSSHIEPVDVGNEGSGGDSSGYGTSNGEDFDSDDFFDDSSGYESPPPPTPCECGYVTDGSDYDRSEYSDYDDYDDYDDGDCHCSYCRRSKSEDGKLSRSYRHHVTCKAKTPFPFKKLPPEVRSTILRLLIPDDRTRPLHLREHDWNDEHDCYYTDDFATPECEAAADSIPTSLFRVDKQISAEALRLFHNQTFFRMDVTPFGISARGGVTRELHSFSSHEVLAAWKAFQCMRNYHINVKSSSVCEIFDPKAMDIFSDPYTYENGAERIKEWLRLVCDELLANDVIQNLTITAPCKCAQKAAGLVPKDESTIADLFAPFKRIRLPNSVVISLHNDRKKKQGIQDPCRRPGCLSLAQTLQAGIGRLQGEPLSEREATWKAVKLLNHHDYKLNKAARKYACYWRDSGIEGVWECLNGRGSTLWSGDDDDPQTFEDAVQHFHARRVDAEVERLERKKEYEERQEAKRQVEQDNGSQEVE